MIVGRSPQIKFYPESLPRCYYQPQMLSRDSATHTAKSPPCAVITAVWCTLSYLQSVAKSPMPAQIAPDSPKPYQNYCRQAESATYHSTPYLSLTKARKSARVVVYIVRTLPFYPLLIAAPCTGKIICTDSMLCLQLLQMTGFRVFYPDLAVVGNNNKRRPPITYCLSSLCSQQRSSLEFPCIKRFWKPRIVHDDIVNSSLAPHSPLRAFSSKNLTACRSHVFLQQGT